MGVLGLGRIGKEIAKRAAAFGVEVVYHGRKPQADAPYLYYPSLMAMAKAVDILDGRRAGRAPTRATSSTPRCWRRSARTACLINIARGSLVDDEALIAALRQRARSSPRGSTCSRTSRRCRRPI